MIPDHYYARFTTAKYQSRNPLQRWLIERFVARFHGLFVDAGPVGSVLEVGCGQGFLSGYLSERFPTIRFVGVDLDEHDIARLRAEFPRIEAHSGNAYDLGMLGSERFDLVVCAEVLEHLDHPLAAIDQMLRHGPRRLILTVPHEPWFTLANLARGRHLRRLGNHPEHVNRWGTGSFRRLLAQRLRVELLVRSFPWQLALAAPADRP